MSVDDVSCNHWLMHTKSEQVTATTVFNRVLLTSYPALSFDCFCLITLYLFELAFYHHYDLGIGSNNLKNNQSLITQTLELRDKL